MMELINAAFLPVNAVFTVLLGLVMLYWITVILGILDVDLFHVDLHGDFDAHVDTDLGADHDMDMGDGGSALKAILHFFYIGEIPVMLLLSIIILCLWALIMIGNHYLNPVNSMLAALPIYAGSTAASLFLGKVIAMPLKRMYKLFTQDCNAPRELIGRICTIIAAADSKTMGQAEVKTKGAPIVLNVFSENEHRFENGDEALIVSQDKERGTYLIAEVNLEN